MSIQAAAPAAGDKIDGSVLKVAAVVVIGAIMSILDVTVVSIALPTFQRVFDASTATVAWTMTGYTLALATVIPLTGWAADRFGTKRLYMVALVLFVLGSVLCSTAWDVSSLIVFRVIQGLGGGMLMPLGMTIMTRAAGPARVGRVMAILGVPMLMGPIGGPILGGWMIQSFSWHWIFLINVPIGVIALIVAAIVLPKDEPTPSESFDFLGMLLLSPGLALLLFGVSSISELGTVLAARVLVPAAIGAVLIVLFVLHAFRPAHPLIDLRLFRNLRLTFAVVTMFLFGASFFGAMLLIPSYFLQVRGQSALDGGLLMIPQGVGAMLTMPLAGRLADKTGPGKIVIAGLGLVTIGVGIMTRIGADTSYVLLLVALGIMGMGMGAAMMPTMTAALQTLTHHEVARGSTLLNIVQQVASSVGTAVMSTVLTKQIVASKFAGPAIAAQQDPRIAAQVPKPVVEQGLQDAAAAFATTFTVAFVLVLVTLGSAFLLPRSKPATPTDAGDSSADGQSPAGEATPAPVPMH